MCVSVHVRVCVCVGVEGGGACVHVCVHACVHEYMYT